MNTQGPLLSHYVSIFRMRDMKRSLNFYTNQLGFEVVFKWGGPVDYTMIQRDKIKIHLACNDRTPGMKMTSGRSMFLPTM